MKRRRDLRRGVFVACKFGLCFGRFSLAPPFEEFQKMADFGVFAKLAIARTYGYFWSGSLRQNVVQWLHFKRIVMKRRRNLRRGVFGAWKFGLRFGRFSLRPPFEEFQKMADFGVFAKLAIARTCGHFWSGGLRQSVVQWLHFKRILIKRRRDLRRGVFGACKFGLRFGRFSLGPPFEEFQKMADFGVYAKLAIARTYGHFWSGGLRQNVVQWLHFKCILMKRRRDLRRGTGKKRTHCSGDIVVNTNVSSFGSARNICCEQNFVSRTQRIILFLFRNIWCSQQVFSFFRAQGNVMSNNVSSFAAVFRNPISFPERRCLWSAGRHGTDQNARGLWERDC